MSWILPILGWESHGGHNRNVDLAEETMWLNEDPEAPIGGDVS